MPHAGTDEAALVKPSRTQSQTKSVVHQNLHAVGALVDEQIRMMGSRFTKHIHDAGQRFVHAGTHVERFYGKPRRIDADHLTSSRSISAHSCAADAGHSMLTARPLRRTTMRIVPSVGLAGNPTGTKPSALSSATSGTVGRMAIGRPLRSAFLTQSRNILAFRPRARATAAIDTPGCWQAPTASALKRALWDRRRRRPVSITCFVVDTCTPNATVKRHPPTSAVSLTDDLTGCLRCKRPPCPCASFKRTCDAEDVRLTAETEASKTA